MLARWRIFNRQKILADEIKTDKVLKNIHNPLWTMLHLFYHLGLWWPAVNKFVKLWFRYPPWDLVNDKLVINK